MQTLNTQPPSSEEVQTPRVLSSETYLPQVLPHHLGTRDLVALFLLNVFWVTNITPIAAGGPAGFTYWILCAALFFIPCSVVMAQLAKLFPSGSISTWTHHALGRRWSFFVGICAWLPGILSIVNATAATISWVQALNSTWLTQTWQQGIMMFVVLILTGVLACQRTQMVQYVLNVAVVAMGLATFLIVLAALLWLGTGHHAVTNFTHTASWQMTPLNFALLGSATLAYLGSDMPLAMAAEIKQRTVISQHLTWGTLLTIAGYLLFTFSVLVVRGATVAATTVNPMVLLISTVEQGLGTGMGSVMAICLLIYFLMIPVALHLCFSRLLVFASVDRHISIWFARLNKHRVPIHALVVQIVIVVGIAGIIYFVVPSISFLGNASDLSNITYNVLGASLLLVWAVSFLFPFLDVVILSFKKPDLFTHNRLVPFPVLVICAMTGVLLCLTTIVLTLQNSFIPTLIPNATWWYVIGGSALACLLLFAGLSLFTNSEATWEEIRR